MRDEEEKVLTAGNMFYNNFFVIFFPYLTALTPFFMTLYIRVRTIRVNNDMELDPSKY